MSKLSATFCVVTAFAFGLLFGFQSRQGEVSRLISSIQDSEGRARESEVREAKARAQLADSQDQFQMESEAFAEVKAAAESSMASTRRCLAQFYAQGRR